MSAENPRQAAKQLKTNFQDPPPFIYKQDWSPPTNLSIADIKNEVAKIVNAVQKETPLVHHLTNNVSLLWLLCLIS
jgi:thiamine-phosphate diphosphorylase / hydroxyethylthiazole kinase